MKELKEETSTQKLYWDSENEIVWGDLFGDQKTEEHAKENVDAQERIRDSLNKEKTRVLIDMTLAPPISLDSRLAKTAGPERKGRDGPEAEGEQGDRRS